MKKRHIWISLFILLIAQWVMVQGGAVYRILQNISYDALQRGWPRTYTKTAPVKIIDIDDTSLRKYGQWPWPRTVMAELVSKLVNAQASAIVFDIVFAEADRTSPKLIGRYFKGHPQLEKMIAQLPDHDRILAEAMQNGMVVLGFSCSSGSLTETAIPVRKARFITAGDDPCQFLHPFQGVVRNLTIFENSAMGNGAFNFIADRDGIIRHLPLLVRIKDQLYPSLTLEAVRVAQGEQNVIVKSSGASGESRFGEKTGVVSVRTGALELATDPQSEIWLHYTPSEPDRYLSAWRILANDFKPDDVAGHIIFIGTSAKGLLDLRFSPLGGVIPGVEIHAQLIEQMIEGSYLRHPDWTRAIVAIALSIMWLVLVLFTGRIRAIWLSGIALACVTAALSLSWMLFTEMKLFVDPLYPCITLVLMYFSCLLVHFLQTEKERRWIKKAFSSYVSPNLVNHLMAHPEQLELGGRFQECSFIMTDLEGFTGFMEKADPKEVSELLNIYIDEILKIAFRCDATLDRIIGDAVALMFSAPVEQKDHAERALTCALEIDQFSRAFSAEQQKRGVAFGITRIGVHSGRVLVGNFGGKSIFDYRALGDPINTCSRLESVNKHLGTRICVSLAVKSQCPQFFGRPIGTLILKGKSQGVEAFEPLSEEAWRHSKTQSYLTAYSKLKNKPKEALAAFLALHEAYPDDSLVAFHLKRLQNGEADVIIQMIQK